MSSILMTVLLALSTICNVAADEPNSSPPIGIESIISSLPTITEVEQWHSMSPEARKSHGAEELSQKFKDEAKNCKQLEALVTAGKSIADYPGLLAIGIIRWNNVKQTYDFWVKVPAMMEGSYGGFHCTIDKTMVITEKRTAIYTL